MNLDHYFMFKVETSSSYICQLFILRCVQLLFCPSFEGSVSFFSRGIIIMEIFCENCFFCYEDFLFFLLSFFCNECFTSDSVQQIHKGSREEHVLAQFRRLSSLSLIFEVSLFWQQSQKLIILNRLHQSQKLYLNLEQSSLIWNEVKHH